MYSPNHPTSNIEDAFSFNFRNYISASSDYVPASPGKTYFESSNNSYGLVPTASPTLLLFHDDPYMKEILPPRKQAHFLSLSSTNLSAQPQAFEIAKNYHGAPDTSHTRHEERIKDILNHFDELSLDHIEEMKGHVDGRETIQQDFDKLKTELQEARGQIAGL
nr:hypothetical protein [Tanacetum cinerariifolium]